MARPGKAAKKEIDPELMMKLKFRAKCQFRACYRKVAANAYWLIEDVDQYEGVDDVKRRVQQAVMGRKKKQLLNIRDKALLNKPAHERTDAEKKYIYRIIGGLKCFKKYPNHVKKKLAAVTYFKYFGPGRVVVKQHQEGQALYFMVTGVATVSHLIWDGLLQEFVSADIGVINSGDMFGEVSLLHNIPRTATVTTTDSTDIPFEMLYRDFNQRHVDNEVRGAILLHLDHCEMLALMKEDFKNVLQASVQKDWDEVHRAMSAFTYFDALDEIGLREGCIFAKMKSFEPNETILGDGEGVANFVYFILSGQCQMIESFQVLVTKRLGKTYYTLYDPYVPKEESDQDIETKYFNTDKRRKKSTAVSLPEIRIEASKLKEPSVINPSKVKVESILKAGSSSKHARVSNDDVYLPLRASTDSHTKEIMANKGSVTSHVDNVTQENSRTVMAPAESETGVRESVRLSVVPEIIFPPKSEKPANLKTVFMQVIRYYPGSTFGFGENMRDRRIVALTPVSCLLLPLVWLLKKNTANIWTRIHYYLEKKIPNKRTLFNEFVNERRWHDFRDQVVEDVVAQSHAVNFTTLHDVPYSIRLDEMQNV